jgi:hypothetical protein
VGSTKRARLVDGAAHGAGGVDGAAWVTTQGEASGPHVVQVEARVVAPEPGEKQAGATGVKRQPDQTQGESRDLCVGRSQQGETHLR